MSPNQVRGILTGAGVAAVLAECFVVLAGFWGVHWGLMLACSAFVMPAAAIFGAHVTAVAIASEGEAEAHELEVVARMDETRRRAA